MMLFRTYIFSILMTYDDKRICPSCRMWNIEGKIINIPILNQAQQVFDTFFTFIRRSANGVGRFISIGIPKHFNLHHAKSISFWSKRKLSRFEIGNDSYIAYKIHVKLDPDSDLESGSNVFAVFAKKLEIANGLQNWYEFLSLFLSVAWNHRE